jgi:hypothetical protein
MNEDRAEPHRLQETHVVREPFLQIAPNHGGAAVLDDGASTRKALDVAKRLDQHVRLELRRLVLQRSIAFYGPLGRIDENRRVIRVDANIVVGQVAPPGRGFEGALIHQHVDEHLVPAEQGAKSVGVVLRGRPALERGDVLKTNGQPIDGKIETSLRCAGPHCGNDTTPVGIGAEESGLRQIRFDDGLRELARCLARSRAGDAHREQVLRPLTVRGDRPCEVSTNFFERGAKYLRFGAAR